MSDFPPRPPYPPPPAPRPYPPPPAVLPPGSMDYGAGAATGASPSPLRGVARALFIIGLVLAVPQVLLAVQATARLAEPARRQLAPPSGGYGARGRSPATYPVLRDAVFCGLVLFADLALIIGAVMGLAGAPAGRMVVLIAVAVLGGVEVLALLLDWFSKTNMFSGYAGNYALRSTVYPYGRYGPLPPLKQWSYIASTLQLVFRRLLYPVLCFVVLTRRSPAAG